MQSALSCTHCHLHMRGRPFLLGFQSGYPVREGITICLSLLAACSGGCKRTAHTALSQHSTLSPDGTGHSALMAQVTQHQANISTKGTLG